MQVFSLGDTGLSNMVVILDCEKMIGIFRFSCGNIIFLKQNQMHFSQITSMKLFVTK